MCGTVGWIIKSMAQWVESLKVWHSGMDLLNQVWHSGLDPHNAIGTVLCSIRK